MARELTKREPWSEIVSLRDAMNRLFEESFVSRNLGWPAPPYVEGLAIDLYETDDSVVIETPIAGVKPEDINITLTDDLLTIEGETKAEEKTEKANYIRQERRYGAFSRTLRLPTQVKADESQAKIADGVLTLTLPKSEEAKPRRIEIAVNPN